MEARAYVVTLPLCLTVKTPISHFYVNLGRIIRDLGLRIRQIKLTHFAACGAAGGAIAHILDASC